ncbi:MAG: hypothetical protein K0Q72_4599 [Armatimonadetes bacterium]|nr:hypothetical protein [Armatimonadota bacterium]
MHPLPIRCRRLAGTALAALLLCAPLALRALSAADLPAGPLPIGARPIDFPPLHNVVRLSEKLYSGAVPKGEAGFRVLERLGIKTVITVDGVPPDVKTAQRFKLRYVHLPFGYDGCPTPTANRIVKAVRDLPGPVYVHCHHGKHRSPTGAEFARIALDGITNEEAVKELERAGTGKNYTGLYADVLAYRPPTRAELDAMKADFPAIAPTPPLVEAMVKIEQRFDRLMKLSKEGWKAEPGVDAAGEALQLQELYAELNRTRGLKKQAADFRLWMEEGERAGKSLEAALRAGKLDDASMFLGKVAAGCGSCHVKYRNVPQGRSPRDGSRN